jgi:DUF4097 and DUF4098 domain-containing protein YvlB
MHLRTALAASTLCLLMAGAAAADIEIHQKHRFDARPGATVVVDLSFHDVEVVAAPGDSVDVVVDMVIRGDGKSSKKAAAELEPQFRVDGDKLIIRSARKSGWSWKTVKAKGKVSIQMPPDIDLSIDSSSGGTDISGDFGDAVIRFDGSSGGLRVDGAAREVRADTSSGSIRAVVMRPLEFFSADVSSGSVSLVGGAHEARVDTSSGSIDLEGLLGEGIFDSSSGSITCRWDAIPAGTKVRADASSGSVTLSFPEDTQLAGWVEVSSGGIRTDFPGTMSKRHLDLKGGPGAVDIAVDTSSGSVRLLSN